MPADILNKLQELRKDSGVSLSPVIKNYLQDHSQPRALVESVLIANAKIAVKPIKGLSSLQHPLNRVCKRKIKTLTSININVINQLNIALLGGERYPVLTAVLGSAAGFASTGGSLIFTAATTYISKNNAVQKVLTRLGDEIWQIEEIGKVGNQPTYISSFFIVDPYRDQTPNKGWLIHEERADVLIN